MFLVISFAFTPLYASSKPVVLSYKVLNSVAAMEEELAYPEETINTIDLLKAPMVPIGDEKEETVKSDQVSVYSVRKGDTLKQIAEMYNVTPNTILWANDLKGQSDIHPDQILVILPVPGVKHVVKKGETIDSIVKKYGVKKDSVIDFNGIDGKLSLEVGDEIIVPGGVSEKGSIKDGYFIRPIKGGVKTQGIHDWNAIDLANKIGTPVMAAAGGEVVVSREGGWNGGYGNYIVIKHSNGMQTLYAHLSETDVSRGQFVNEGDVIGKLGNTGRSTGPHLHFEVRGGKNPF